MNVSPEEFRRRFDGLTDEALLEVNRDELIPIAQELYDAELAKRGLDLGEAHEGEVEPVGGEQPEPHGELVLAAEFTSAQEAAFARSLLKSAGIPYFSKTDFSGILGGTEEELQVYVPAPYLQEAQDLLDKPLTDEELAAQAEAAGHEEEAEEADAGEGPEPDEDIKL